MTTLAEKHINPERTAQRIHEIAEYNYRTAVKNNMSDDLVKGMHASLTMAKNVVKQAREFGLTASQVKRVCKVLDDDTDAIMKAIASL